MQQKVSPHWGWFLLAPVFLVVGVVAFVVIVFSGALGVAEGMQHVSVPGEGTVTFDEPGEYTIFYEQRGVMQAEIPTGLRVEVTPVGGEKPLQHIIPGGKFTYKNNDVAGRNFGRIDVPGAGEYRVRTSVSEGVATSGRVALGGDPSGKLLGAVFGSMGALVGGVVLALVHVIVIAVLRAKNRKKLRPPGYAAPRGTSPPVPHA